MTATSYEDSALAAGTYYYRVTADDAAGNIERSEGGGRHRDRAGHGAADCTPASLTANSRLGFSDGSSWTAATDNVGVARYNVHRSTTAGFTPAAANRIAQATGTSYTDPRLAAGTYYYRVTAEDAAGNVSAPSPSSRRPSRAVASAGAASSGRTG